MEETQVQRSRGVHDANVLREWTVAEYTQHERGRGWFIVASAVALFLLIISFWTPNFIFDRPNFLFAVIIVLAGLTLLVRHYRTPPLLDVVLYEDGIGIGEMFYSYRDLGTFWIIYEPPAVKTLYLHFQSTWRPRLPIPLENENPVAIRQILLEYLPEDLERESEPTSDALERLLRL